MAEGREFRWNDEDCKANIVVQPIDAIAAYTNPEGNIVIRQLDPYADEDQVVIIPRQHIDIVIKAIQDRVAES